MKKPLKLIIGLAVILLALRFLGNYQSAKQPQKPQNIIENTQAQSPGQTQSQLQAAVKEQTSQADCLTDPESIPVYSGKDYVVLRGGVPNFTDWELKNITGACYSELDRLGRCRAATAMLDISLRPDKERGRITEVRPTGWKQNKYPGLIDTEPPYLYNRSHLIAYSLAGQEANPQNLITGTRHMNAEVMQEWEIEVYQYLSDHKRNHVLYRVTPYFFGQELLARGVEMEAVSVEDAGAGICFHIFIYNVQPGVTIDYGTGENHLSK